MGVESLYVLPEEIQQFIHCCIHTKLLNLLKIKDQKSDLHSIGTVQNIKTSLPVLKEKKTFKNEEIVCRLKLHRGAGQLQSLLHQWPKNANALWRTSRHVLHYNPHSVFLISALGHLKVTGVHLRSAKSSSLQISFFTQFGLVIFSQELNSFYGL